MNYKLLAYAQDFVSFLMQNLTQKYTEKISQIILFGSVVRNDANKESDLDLFLESSDKNLEKEIIKIKELFSQSLKVKKYWSLLGVSNEINCIIGKIEEWDELKRSLISQGIILYGKYSGQTKTDVYHLFTLNQSPQRNKNISIWRKLYGYKQKVGSKIYHNQGLIREYDGKKLGKGVFLIPALHTQKIISYLNKQKFKYQIIMIWLEKK